MTISFKTFTVVIATTLFSGCATDDPHQRAKIGAGIGAVAGAVLGHQANDDNGKFVGAAAGAAAGAAIGNYMDKQQREMEEQLADEQRSKEIELERVQEDTIKLNLSSEVSFDTDSSAIKPSFYSSLNKISGIINQYDQTTIRIVGHTDSRGSDEHNQILSEKRAESVRSYLNDQGVSMPRMRTIGMGETQPIGDNSSRSGQSENRRVEIFLKSVQQD